MNDNRRQAYIEWATGLDTEPPLEGAFNAGWLARDAEVERLRAALEAALWWWHDHPPVPWVTQAREALGHHKEC